MPKPEPETFTKADYDRHWLRVGHLMLEAVEQVARENPEVLVRIGRGELLARLREQGRA